jgi:hypothetical protein
MSERRQGPALVLAVSLAGLSEDPRTNLIRRHHSNFNGVQQLLKRAAARAGLTNR